MFSELDSMKMGLGERKCYAPISGGMEWAVIMQRVKSEGQNNLNSVSEMESNVERSGIEGIGRSWSGRWVAEHGEERIICGVCVMRITANMFAIRSMRMDGIERAMCIIPNICEVYVSWIRVVMSNICNVCVTRIIRTKAAICNMGMSRNLFFMSKTCNVCVVCTGCARRTMRNTCWYGRSDFSAIETAWRMASRAKEAAETRLDGLKSVAICGQGFVCLRSDLEDCSSRSPGDRDGVDKTRSAMQVFG